MRSVLVYGCVNYFALRNRVIQKFLPILLSMLSKKPRAVLSLGFIISFLLDFS